MKSIRYAALALLLALSTMVWAQRPILKFNADGKFKILQLSDLHLDPASIEGSDATAATVKNVIALEHPDLVMLTGDVVTEKPADKGWDFIIGVMESTNVPYAVVMGNHDAEKWPKADIYHRLAKSHNYVGEAGPVDIFGMGNFVLPVLASDGSSKVAALVYGIDSNDYPTDKFYGHYDWIHFDQIAWYRSQSEAYTRLNGGKPLPAIGYFHIPTAEFDAVKFVGSNRERGSSRRINSGFISSALEMGDLMGCFVGHNHMNDMVGTYYGMLLGYCRCTGTDAYGTLVRGGRIVELTEGDHVFDTWVSTPEGREYIYHYPSGITSTEEETMEYLPATDAKAGKNGVKYTYFEGKYKRLAHVKPEDKKGEGTLLNFVIDQAPAEDHFAYNFEALIDIPERGVYNFFTFSDDGSAVYIDGKLVVDNDGSHNDNRVEGRVALEKGLHRIEVRYIEDYMGQLLEVGISSRGIKECLIPDSMLYVPKK